MKSRIIDVSNGKITLTVPKNRLNSLNNLIGEECDVEITKHRKKRSLDANSYMWVLCSKLAEVHGSTKDEIYRFELRRYSTWWDDIYVSENMFNFLKSQEDKEDAQYRVVDEMDRQGKMVKARVYLGSRHFDTYMMSKVIDGIVSDCKDEGIDTMTPDEIARLTELWHK